MFVSTTVVSTRSWHPATTRFWRAKPTIRSCKVAITSGPSTCPQPHQRLRIRFLLAAALAMFAFAVLLPVIVFVAVVSDSAALATMVTYFVALMSLIFSQHERIAPYFDSQWPRDLVKGLYHVFPKLYEIGNTARLLLMERALESWMPIWSSGIFAVVVLGAGVWFFQRKDY